MVTEIERSILLEVRPIVIPMISHETKTRAYVKGFPRTMTNMPSEKYISEPKRGPSQFVRGA
jgi:hypothetical protein